MDINVSFNIIEVSGNLCCSTACFSFLSTVSVLFPTHFWLSMCLKRFLWISCYYRLFILTEKDFFLSVGADLFSLFPYDFN